LAAFFTVLYNLHWRLYFDYLHDCLGIITTFFVMILVFGGIYSQVMRRYVNLDWQTKKMLKLK